MGIRIKLRRDVLKNWTNANPVLEDGELVYIKDLDAFKIGDGVRNFNNLPKYKMLVDISLLNEVKIVPPAKVNQQAGHSLAMSSDGTVLAIGAPYYNHSGASNTGRVFIYKKNGTGWTLDQTIVPPVQEDQQAGHSLAMSSDGNVLAVGAPNDGVDRVFIYKRIDYDWSLHQTIDLPSPANQAQDAGHSLAMSSDGTVLAVGAPDYSNSNYIATGRVFIYKKNGTDWTLHQTIVPPTQRGQQAGHSLAMSFDGTVLAVGAPGYTSVDDSNTGCVFIYKKNGTDWSLDQTIVPPVQEGQEAGHSLTMSYDGTVLVIGAPSYDHSNTTRAGRVFVCKNLGHNWLLVQIIIPPVQAYQQAGHSLAMSFDGTVLAVGAFGYSQDNTRYTGRVFIYKKNGDWSLDQTIIPPVQAYQQAGYSLAMSSGGNVLAIGAPDYDASGVQDTGCVYTRF